MPVLNKINLYLCDIILFQKPLMVSAFNPADNQESKFKYRYNDRGDRIEEIEYFN
jgi:hypothetical protein